MFNPVDAGTLIPIENDIIAAGPLTKQPHSVPFRVVLRVQPNGGYVVHNQYFPEVGKPSFCDGSYFQTGPENFVDATKKFADRVTRYAPTLATAYRS